MYAKSDYFAQRSVPNHPDKLDPNDCIALGEGDTAWVFQAGSQTIKIAPQNRYKVNNLLLIQKAVMKGVGISVLPQRMGAPYLGKQLVQLLKNYPLEQGDVFAVYPSKKYISSKLSVFLDYLQKHLFYS